MSANLAQMSEDDKKARLWLLRHLDLVGTGSSPQPGSTGSNTVQGLDLAGTGAPDKPGVKKTVEDNKAVGKLADQLLKALEPLKLPEQATPRQTRLLATATDAVRQLVRDENMQQAQEKLKDAVKLFKELKQEVEERLAREKRHGELPALSGLLAGQQKRLDQSNEAYKKAEAEERASDAENALQNRERLQQILEQEVKERLARMQRHAKLPPLTGLSKGQQSRLDQANQAYQTAEDEERASDAEIALGKREELQETLTEELVQVEKLKALNPKIKIPVNANASEKSSIEEAFNEIRNLVKDDLFKEAVQAATTLLDNIEKIKKRIEQEMGEAKQWASKILASADKHAKDLCKGEPQLQLDVGQSLLENHPAAKDYKNRLQVLQTCDSGKPKRTDADEINTHHQSISDGLDKAAEDIAEQLEQNRASMAVIEQLMARGREYLEKTNYQQRNFMPSAWNSWPKLLPKPDESTFPEVTPEYDKLNEKLEAASKALHDATEIWKTETDAGKRATGWTGTQETSAKQLMQDCKKAWQGFYGVMATAVYDALAAAKQQRDKELKESKERLLAYIKAQSANTPLPPLQGKETEWKDQIYQAAERSNKSGNKESKRLDGAEEFVAELLSNVKQEVEKAEAQRGQDGAAPKEDVQDPTHFGGHTDYIVVGSLQSKPVYARFDSTVTSSSNFDNAYRDAMGNGVIASTSTGQAGIKKEPYGWVVKVTLSRALALNVDNLQSPRASAGLQLSAADEPAFYLNFDEWVSRH
ncbi:MAG TPA: hypothetical protein H9903_07330 [Candidatus Aquabacterium excrementipullorum]|nr:hypothetical protein [Candidatus Aquabacterium excrementipullorum]